MTPAELRDLKKSLYRDAVRDGTVSLCWLVGRAFGRPDLAEPNRLHYFADNLAFLVDESAHYLCVWYRGIPVCLSRRDHWSFLPGTWTDTLRRLAVRARQRLERAEAKRLEAEVNSLLAARDD